MTTAPAGLVGAPRLQRATRGRALAGVCRGLSDHLGLPVLTVRIGFLVLAACQGAGVAMYAAFWVLAPLAADPREGPPDEGWRSREAGYLAGLAAVGIGGLLLLGQLGVGLPSEAAWPLGVVGFGVVILWRQADDVQRLRWRQATVGVRGIRLLRAAVGFSFVTGGSAVFLAGTSEISGVAQVLLAIAVVTFGLAVVTGPWWLRMARDLTAERAARIREQERAEFAAHVHDSVLHTLTLIQRSVDDPREVARLARAQERDLRTWLYRPTADPHSRLASALERTAADVEDAHGVTVDVVVVGDLDMDPSLQALLQAAREALVNAAKYAGASPLSLYAEVEPGQVTVFVRDRGKGFDLDAVPEDRLGLRQSVIGRMDRHGGRAQVRTAPGEGTEITLQMPVHALDDRRTTA